MAVQTLGRRHSCGTLTQPGSTGQKWNKEELRRCGAIGTAKRWRSDLQGEIHPVFANWVKTDSAVRKELEQPLLLASRILETAGLPWASDFLVDDIFDAAYPGQEPSCSFKSARRPRDSGSRAAPRTIVRHHRTPWATSQMKEEWLGSTKDQLRNQMARAITWQLDGDMFRAKGWVGYTCRHPRGDLGLDELDRYETIERFDHACQDRRYRSLTILLTAEFPIRLAHLRQQGKEQGEEYLLTAFMAAVTILHELGHALYWKDCRSLTGESREPFYGADLEMELGDSFIASIFGGWIPVPIRDLGKLRAAFTFEDGLCWRQALSWDFHRLRPKHRVHYSVAVDYVARLFTEKAWSGGDAVSIAGDVVRPRTLVRESLALRRLGIQTALTDANQHAAAAIADFHCTGEGWMWNRRPGARFRIPQYDGYLCPDLDLPIATDDVIKESSPRGDPASTPTRTSPRRSVQAGAKEHMPDKRGDSNNNTTPTRRLSSRAEPLKNIRPKQEPETLSPDRAEISLDELKKRLSRLLGVSLSELEKLFETAQCA
ncbi:hypothetical protein F4779DRAFT_7854 [Xylariaceae sp. FL0662B]|nr:hypothetical protein F4779DRAFT_7854 [Xylariaceae sp. FL0662B]